MSCGSVGSAVRGFRLVNRRSASGFRPIVSHARLLKLGVDSYLYFMEGAWHAASSGTRGSPEERDVNTYIGRWFGQHLAR